MSMGQTREIGKPSSVVAGKVNVNKALQERPDTRPTFVLAAGIRKSGAQCTHMLRNRSNGYILDSELGPDDDILNLAWQIKNPRHQLGFGCLIITDC